MHASTTQEVHPMDSQRFKIRLATPGDATALRWLAALGGMQGLSGHALLAEDDGVPSAALSLETGAEAADPYQPGDEALRALRARRARLLAPVWRGRKPRA